MSVHRWVVTVEAAWDAVRLRRAGSRTPAHFRIEPYVGHGGAEGVVVRGRVVDDPPLSEAVEGEGVLAAFRRVLRGFMTDELPGVPLRATVAGTSVETATDAEGYFLARLRPDVDKLVSPWTSGTVELGADVSRACRRARHAARGPGPGAEATIRDPLRHRRHDPRDRCAAGRSDDPPDVHRLRPHADAVSRARPTCTATSRLG